MAVDENGNPIIEPSNEPSQAQQRITQLSEKVRLTSEERDEKARLLQEATEKQSLAEKERDFYQGFSDVVATNPAAKDHKDAILEKVKLGYTPEDAAYAVLGKAGLLGTQAPTPVMAAGGSASNTITQNTEKPVAEMSQQERRDQLSKDLIWQQ